MGELIVLLVGLVLVVALGMALAPIVLPLLGWVLGIALAVWLFVAFVSFLRELAVGIWQTGRRSFAWMKSVWWVP